MSQRAALLTSRPLLTPCEWMAQELPKGLMRPPQPPKHRGSLCRVDRPVPFLQTLTAKKPLN